MPIRTGPTWIAIIAVMVILVVAVAAIWTAAPEDLRGWLLLAGGAITVAVYGALYVLQRRRHW